MKVKAYRIKAYRIKGDTGWLDLSETESGYSIRMEIGGNTVFLNKEGFDELTSMRYELNVEEKTEDTDE